ncbi:hypothetical protein [Nocardia asiatica]|uniref:hypothetical protein n=1 Tax=Nocardia asiatica TaxID=209252 RepID=UPI002455603A|nr:hypothetical protein [Nocardia asiatica]
MGRGKKQAPEDVTKDTNCTFSVRFHSADFDNLNRYARVQGVSVADQARAFVLDGLKNALDPAEIERLMDEEKDRLLAYARELRGDT